MRLATGLVTGLLMAVILATELVTGLSTTVRLVTGLVTGLSNVIQPECLARGLLTAVGLGLVTGLSTAVRLTGLFTVRTVKLGDVGTRGRVGTVGVRLATKVGAVGTRARGRAG